VGFSPERYRRQMCGETERPAMQVTDQAAR